MRITELLSSVVSACELSSLAWGRVKPVDHGHVSSASACAAVSRHQLAAAFCWVVKLLNAGLGSCTRFVWGVVLVRLHRLPPFRLTPCSHSPWSFSLVRKRGVCPVWVKLSHRNWCSAKADAGGASVKAKQCTYLCHHEVGEETRE